MGSLEVRHQRVSYEEAVDIEKEEQKAWSQMQACPRGWRWQGTGMVSISLGLVWILLEGCEKEMMEAYQAMNSISVGNHKCSK